MGEYMFKPHINKVLISKTYKKCIKDNYDKQNNQLKNGHKTGKVDTFSKKKLIA